MIKKIILSISLILLFNQSFASGQSATSAHHPQKLKWEFEGFFGRFDKQSSQRGYQIYKEVCSSCHSMKRVAYRNLAEIGFGEDEIKQIADEYLVVDGPDDSGDMFERSALPSDRFVAPFANEKAARASNGGAYPPDLSLIIKARPDGANYVYSLLTGFEEAPEDFDLTEGKYYNPYFEGHQISMAPPLPDDEIVEYQDGTFAAREQMAIDLVNFLQFAAEPETEVRKQVGVKVMIFLLIMTILFAIAKTLVWRQIK
ncbi:MAG: ubiquinol-cytochrome c reductase cytochrome c1 subunit [Rickettsiales bacterium]|jgi:ubiquinol-cytochrome c reductase cytochrome c1 subunit